MPLTAVLGLQWGDEGKGKIADYLAKNADIVARFAGGGNAGHTVFRGDKVFRLHHLPVGILHEHVTAVLGNGMVIHPETLWKEMEELAGQGIRVSPDRVKISDRAHVVTEDHMEEDARRESRRKPLGTTKRGIGPAYAHKAYRDGLRTGDYVESSDGPIANFLRPYVTDTVSWLNGWLADGKRVIAEGAQGMLLDIDHGTYPYVSSSNCTIGGVFVGLGVPPQYLTRTIGVVKAFQTRIGTGPFPSEVKGEILEKLRGDGSKPTDEFGATTGRPRRCGWLDIPRLKTAIQINGIEELALTKLDALTGLSEVQIYMGDTIPRTSGDEIGGRLHSLMGWQEDISQCKFYDELPEQAVRFVETLQLVTRTPIRHISVGPRAEQTIVK